MAPAHYASTVRRSERRDGTGKRHARDVSKRRPTATAVPDRARPTHPNERTVARCLSRAGHAPRSQDQRERVRRSRGRTTRKCSRAADGDAGYPRSDVIVASWGRRQDETEAAQEVGVVPRHRLVGRHRNRGGRRLVRVVATADGLGRTSEAGPGEGGLTVMDPVRTPCCSREHWIALDWHLLADLSRSHCSSRPKAGKMEDRGSTLLNNQP